MVMKNTILTSLLTAALLFVCTAHAGLYKGLDDEGNVIYSDKPFENAEQFTPPPLSIMDAPKVKPKEEAVEEPAEFKYTDFNIGSPKNNQTIWNEPDLIVTLQLKPALNTAEGHTVWLMMDKKPLVKNSQSMSLPIGRADRGAHQLQAQVRTKEGKILVRTRAIVVHIKNSVVPRAVPRAN
jgi:hypothetical protein